MTANIIICTLLAPNALILLIMLLCCATDTRKKEVRQMLKHSLDEGPGGMATKGDCVELFHDSANDLLQYKRSQWRITHYALLVYAGLLGTLKLLPEPPPWHRIAIAVVALAVLDFSFYQIHSLQWDLVVTRVRIHKCEHLFRIAFYWKTEDEILSLIDRRSKFWHDRRYIVLFLTSVVVGFITVCGFLLWGYKLW